MKIALLLAIPASSIRIDNVQQALTTSSSPTPGNVVKTLTPTITLTRIPTPLPTFLDATPAPSFINESGVPSFQPSRLSSTFPTEGGDGSVSGVPVTSAPHSSPPRKPTSKPKGTSTNKPTYVTRYNPTRRPINIAPITACDDYNSNDDEYDSHENIGNDNNTNDLNYNSYEMQHDADEWHSDMHMIETDNSSSKSGKGEKSGKGRKGSHKAGKRISKSGKGRSKSSKSTRKLGKRPIGNNGNEDALHVPNTSEKGDNKSGRSTGKKWHGDMDGGHPSWWDGYYRGLRQVKH